MTFYLLSIEIDTWKNKSFLYVQSNKIWGTQPLLKALDFGEAHSRVLRRRFIKGPPQSSYHKHLQKSPLKGQGGLRDAGSGKGALLNVEAEEKAVNSAQCKGRAAAICMASQEQGQPPTVRIRHQIPGGPGEEEEMSGRSVSDNELSFHL